MIDNLFFLNKYGYFETTLHIDGQTTSRICNPSLVTNPWGWHFKVGKNTEKSFENPKNLKNIIYEERLTTFGLNNSEESQQRGDLIFMYKLTKGYESLKWENNNLKIRMRTIKAEFKENVLVLKGDMIFVERWTWGITSSSTECYLIGTNYHTK